MDVTNDIWVLNNSESKEAIEAEWKRIRTDAASGQLPCRPTTRHHDYGEDEEEPIRFGIAWPPDFELQDLIMRRLAPINSKVKIVNSFCDPLNGIVGTRVVQVADGQLTAVTVELDVSFLIDLDEFGQQTPESVQAMNNEGDSYLADCTMRALQYANEV